VLARMQRNLCIAHAVARWCSCCEKIPVALQKFKHRTTIRSSNPNPGYIPQRIKSRHSDHCILKLIEALFTVAKSESNLTAHQEKNG